MTESMQSPQTPQAIAGSPRGMIPFGSYVNCELPKGFEVKVSDHVSAVSTILAQKANS